MKPYISVVIPVYNAGKGLRKCIMSLVEQTLENIEILIVDKSSTDGSKDIEAEFAERYPDKIKIFDLPYSFVAAKGREFGVLHAEADYVAFSDADDWYEPNAMKILWDTVKNSDLDMVTYAWNVVNNDKVIKVSQSSKSNDAGQMILSEDMCTFWSKLIRKQLILDHLPMPMVLNDDVSYVTMIVSYAKKIKYLDMPLYNYVQGVGVTNIKANRNAISIIDGFEYALSESNPKYLDEIVFFVASRYRYARLRYLMFKWEYINWLKSKAELLRANKYIQNNTIVQAFIENDLNNTTELVPNIVYFNGFEDIDTAERTQELLETAFSSNEKTVVPIDEEYHRTHKNDISEAIFKSGDMDKLVLYYVLNAINENGGYYIGNKIRFTASLGSIREYKSFFAFRTPNINDEFVISDDIFGGIAGSYVIKDLLDAFTEGNSGTTVSDIFKNGFANKCGIPLTGNKFVSDDIFVADPAMCMVNDKKNEFICKHTDYDNASIYPAFDDCVTLITLSSAKYVPYLAVWLRSFLCHFSDENNYDVIVFESEISNVQKKRLLEMVKDKKNVSLRFVNPDLIIGQNNFFVASGQFAKEAYYRIFAPWILTNFSRVIITDCDLLAMTDIKPLFDTDMGDKPLGSVKDYIYQGMLMKNPEKYSFTINEMGMKNPFNYVNTGVLLIDLDMMREKFSFSDVMEYSLTHHFPYQEQDIINAYFQDDIYYLDLTWNFYVNLNKNTSINLGNAPVESRNDYYSVQSKGPAIIHYASVTKPWMLPQVRYAEEFWQYARSTPWYEYMLYNMSITKANNTNNKTNNNSKQAANANQSTVLRIAKPIANVILPVGTKRREKVKRIYVRETDKKLLEARKEMYARINKFRADGKKSDSIYYPSMEYYNSIKRKYAGKRCFIVGTGPSLTVEDLNNLKNEITFSLNSIYKMFDKTDWRPDFYVNNDIALEYKMAMPLSSRINDLKKAITEYDFNRCFISLSKIDQDIYNILGEKVTFVPAEDYLYQFSQPYIASLSNDCRKRVQAFGTTVVIAYQIAYFMGFTDIYLLGTDCSYIGKSHAYDQSKDDAFLYGNKERAIGLSGALLRGFEAIRQHSEKNGVNVYNATRGGKLELFPRVDFDQIINSKIEDEK